MIAFIVNGAGQKGVYAWYASMRFWSRFLNQFQVKCINAPVFSLGMAQNHIVPFGVQQLLELIKGAEEVWEVLRGAEEVREVKTADNSDIVDAE